MRCRFSVVFLVSLAGLLHLASNCSAAEQPDKLPPEAMAGQVVDAAGKPVAGATVWLVGGPYDEDATVLSTTTSNTDGQFVFYDAKSLWASEKRRLPTILARTSRGQVAWDSHPWAWSSGIPRRDLNLKLCDVRDYPARLLNAAGKPIAGASVRLHSFNSASLDNSHHPGVEVPHELADELCCETVTDGSFTLRGMPSGGSVWAKVTAAGYGNRVVVAWNVRDDITLQLQPAGSIRGKFLAPVSAAGLASLKLYLSRSGDDATNAESAFRVSYYAPAYPDKNGVFEISDLPPGSYSIHPELYDSNLPYCIAGETKCVIKPKDTASVEIRLLPAAATRGQVVDSESGRGLAKVRVSASNISDKGQMIDTRRTTTDAEGKYIAYSQPGKVIIRVDEAPSGYVAPLRNEEPRPAVAGKEVAWPTIKLDRAVQLDGLVVDEAGKPLADAEVQCLVQRRWLDLEQLRTDSAGRFTLKSLHGKETMAVRARLDGAASDIAQFRPAEQKEPLRLVVLRSAAFAVRGQCVDAARKPIAGAKIAASGSWMLGPTGIGTTMGSTTTDAQGRFEIRGLWPGSQYRISADAEGFDKLETRDFKSRPAETHDVGQLKLVGTGGAISGVVVDTSQRPIAGVRVFNAGDAPKVLETKTDAAGRFELKGLRVGPVYVFAEEDGYRFSEAYVKTNTPNVRLTLSKTDDAVPTWKPERAPLSENEARVAARRLLDKIRAMPKVKSYWAVAFLAKLDPQEALKWSGGAFDAIARTTMAEQIADADADEALALLTRCNDFEAYCKLNSLAARFAESDPEKAMRMVEEAIQRARRLDQPNRTWALAGAAAIVTRLGKREAAKQLAEETADMAAKLGTEGRSIYTRSFAAGALGPYDLDRAIQLMENTAGGHEKDRGLARIAIAIASSDLKKSLELVGRIDKTSTLPDNTRLQIAYDLARNRPEDALRVVESMNTHGAEKIRAEAYAWLATVIAARDRRAAHALIDKSMAIYWANPEAVRSWSNYGGRPNFAARVAGQAHEIGYHDIGTLVNRVMAMRPTADEFGSPRYSRQAMIFTAKTLAVLDPESARRILLTVSSLDPSVDNANAVMEDRDLLVAWALVDLPGTEKLVVTWLDGDRGDKVMTESMVRLFDALTSSSADRPRVIDRMQRSFWWPDEEP